LRKEVRLEVNGRNEARTEVRGIKEEGIINYKELYRKELLRWPYNNA
jgi:hypothetical protein